MNAGQYQAFNNAVEKIQKEDCIGFKGKLSDQYNFAENEIVLIWDDNKIIPADIILKVNQAAAKYLA
jgi:hypothetical protein